MGHYVFFDSDCAGIVKKTTGEVNSLREDNGNYMLDVWIPPNDQGFGGHP